MGKVFLNFFVLFLLAPGLFMVFIEEGNTAPLAPFSSEQLTKSQIEQIVLPGMGFAGMNITPAKFSQNLRELVAGHLGVSYAAINNHRLAQVVRESHVLRCLWSPGEVKMRGIRRYDGRVVEFKRAPYPNEKCLVHPELGHIISLWCLNTIRDLRVVVPRYQKQITLTPKAIQPSEQGVFRGDKHNREENTIIIFKDYWRYYPPHHHCHWHSHHYYGW